MANKTAGILTKLNLPLTALWLASGIVTLVGWLVLSASNATQAEFYTSESQDYAGYFAAQSGSTLGSVLIGAGVLGMILAIASQVRVRPAVAAVVVEDELVEDDDDFEAEPELNSEQATDAPGDNVDKAPEAELQESIAR